MLDTITITIPRRSRQTVASIFMLDAHGLRTAATRNVLTADGSNSAAVAADMMRAEADALEAIANGIRAA